MEKLDKYLKYEKMLELEEKKDIIKEIKQDILNSISNISINELEVVSYTIYLCCVLMVNGEKSEDILEYGMYINHDNPKFLFQICKEYEKTEVPNENIYIDICRKYIEIIRERVIKHQ